MPNYTDNILEIFIPRPMAHLAPQVIAALAGENMDTTLPETDDDRQNRHGTWIDFRRLLPIPEELHFRDNSALADAALLIRGRWPANYPKLDAMPQEKDDLIARAAAIDPEAATIAQKLLSNIETYGVPYASAYQQARWGTKWVSGDSPPPKIEDAAAYDHYCDMGDSVMITWRFTTAWSCPSGYYERLAELCSRHGFGMMAWYSDEDGGSRWDPLNNESCTIWTEYEDVRVVPEELPESDILAICGKGVDFGPDEGKIYPKVPRDPIHELYW